MVWSSTMPTKKYKNQDAIDYTDKIAVEITGEKFSNCYRDHFFPLLIEKLGFQSAVEVGTDQGLFAKHLMEKTNLQRLYCVDPWLDDFGSNHKPDYYDRDGGNREKDARGNLKEFIDARRCFILKGFSADIADNFEDYVDFVYIDGDHSLEGIYTDLYSWVPKVKSGGIIAGHDYKDGPKSGMQDYWGGQLDYKVKTVVDNFCQQYGFKLNVVGGRIKSFWFVNNR